MAGFGGKGADLDAEIAVAPFGGQFVVGKTRHFNQVLGFFIGQPETRIKQAGAHGYGDGEAVGAEGFAQKAAAGGRQLGVAVGQLAATGEKFDAGGEGAQQVLQLRGGLRGHVKCSHDGKRLMRGGDALLVGAVAGVTFAAVLGGVGFFIGAAFFLAIGKAACGSGKAGGTGGERAFEQGAFGGLGGSVGLGHGWILGWG